MNNSNQASNSGGFSFGSTSASTGAATPSTGFTFGGQTAQNSSATPSTGFSFGSQAAQTSSATPSTGFSFGNLASASSATSTTAFNLPASTAPTSSAAPLTGLNFGNPTTSASSGTSATAFKLPASTATTNSAASLTGFSFTTGPTTTKSILASSLSQPGGVSTSAPVSQAVATGLTGAKPGDITKAAAGPSIGSSLSAGVVKSSGSAIGSQLSSSLSMPATGPCSKTASVTTSGPSTVTTTTATSLTGTTGAAGSSGEGSGTKMTYKELEEQMNKWAMELEHQEKLFLEQATKVNAWDKVLIKNGEEITTLNSEVAKVKLDQRRLNDELDFIVAQQKELEEMLVPLEENVAKLPAINYQQHTDSEREHTYQIAEHIDAQLKRMTEDLKEVVDHLNTGTSSQDKSDPMLQISKILNAHMESLQWVDQNAAVLQKKTEEVARYADYTKKEHEKNFRLAYS
ncbi:Nup62 [Bugula neritina]|uniref:Nup62 n=1 Tax=Bugula neritina TaxID=10212 RepID=A0A7J7J1W6_BUGNE|nr:Nup62 [Bugula neritina]